MTTEPFLYKSYCVEPTIINNKINRKSYKTLKNTYTILNYNRDFVCNDDLEIGKYRSVIISSVNNSLLSFSPPKSITYDLFIEKYPNITDSIIVSEIIEGTMINLWYDLDVDMWEISTKSAIGGKYYYYRTEYFNETKTQDTTFYNMFLDALRIDHSTELDNISILDSLPKNYCYSFVLQHPDNHIVLPIKTPCLYLVAVYDIKDNRAITIPKNVYQEWECFIDMGGIIQFPMIYDYLNENENTFLLKKEIIEKGDNGGATPPHTYQELQHKFSSIQGDYNYLGVMITNMETGERTKIQNSVYDEVKTLRGNNPNLQYQYLCLRRMNKITDFVTYFPCYKKLFFKFFEQYKQFVTNIHKSYITRYVKRTNEEISKKYLTHIYRLHHNIYIPSLSQESLQKRIITKYIVQEYLDSLEPSELLYFLNYETRKYTNDVLVTNENNIDICKDI